MKRVSRWLIVAAVPVTAWLFARANDLTPPAPPVTSTGIHSTAREAPGTHADPRALVEPRTTAERINGPRTVVSFPWGEVVNVPVRLAKRDSNRDPPRFGDAYAGLRIRATNGDASAAGQLARGLMYCARAFTTDAEMARAVEQLHQNRVLQRADMPVGEPVSGELNVNEVEAEQIREPYEYCQGLSAAQKQEAQQWLLRAADAGDPWALFEHARQLGTSPGAFRAWERLWNTGVSQGSLGHLSWLSEHGHRNEPQTPDVVSAYAYSYLDHQLVKSTYEGVNSPIYAQMIEGKAARLADLERRLRPAEIQAAIQQAKQILVENRACCVLP